MRAAPAPGRPSRFQHRGGPQLKHKLNDGNNDMIPATTSEHEPDDRLTGAGFVFLAISIVIGMGIGGVHTYSLVAGVAMLILPAIIYLVGSARRY